MEDKNIEQNNIVINNEKEKKNYQNYNFVEIKEELLKMRKLSIIGICFAFTLIGIIVTLIIEIICGVKILSKDWKYKELEEHKIIWGILSFVGLGIISPLIFSCIGISNIEKNRI